MNVLDEVMKVELTANGRTVAVLSSPGMENTSRLASIMAYRGHSTWSIVPYDTTYYVIVAEKYKTRDRPSRIWLKRGIRLQCGWTSCILTDMTTRWGLEFHMEEIQTGDLEKHLWRDWFRSYSFDRCRSTVTTRVIHMLYIHDTLTVK